ncbi:nitrate- and nitrite sensing domain-containing protein [Candidatus Wolfebacteria bacterium]|nr:nitrate- and nitrite sensing domain-containing protein [Candidatus Wolfebacteria bacterium]
MISSIKTKILILVILPLLASVYFIALEIGNKREMIFNTEKVKELVNFSIKSNSLIHEIQTERGMTNGFIGSNGKEFKNELIAQRIAVDAKKKELENFLINFQPEKFGVKFNDKFNTTILKLNKIEKHREKVSSLAISGEESLGFYTELINLILDNTSYVSKVNSNQEITLFIEDYVNFLKGKEYTGLERAMGTKAFSQNKFEKNDYNKFLSVITSQDIYFNNFKKFATEEQIKFFDGKMLDQSFVLTKNLRNILLEKSSEGNFRINPKNWFDAMTIRMDLLKNVENKIVDDLIIAADGINKKVRKDLLLFLSIEAIVLIIVLISSILIILSIIRPIKKLQKGIEIISSGNLDFQVDIKNKDEMGLLADSFNKMTIDLKKSKLKLKEFTRRPQDLENLQISDYLPNSAKIMDIGAQYNYNDAIEVAPGIFWVGFYDKDAIFSCNPYLIVDGEEAVLIDGGSLGHFPFVARKVFSIIEPSKIKNLILHHMDPDLCASLPLFQNIINQPDFKVISHRRASVLIAYYSQEKVNFYYPEENNNIFRFSSGRILRFIPAHYLHTPGTINTYDEKTKTLFSSDIFGAFTPKWELYADKTYFEKMRKFHENYMPSKEIMAQYLERIKKLDIKMICSQHGSIIKENFVALAIKALENFEYGKYME